MNVTFLKPDYTEIDGIIDIGHIVGSMLVHSLGGTSEVMELINGTSKNDREELFDAFLKQVALGTQDASNFDEVALRNMLDVAKAVKANVRINGYFIPAENFISCKFKDDNRVTVQEYIEICESACRKVLGISKT